MSTCLQDFQFKEVARRYLWFSRSLKMYLLCFIPTIWVCSRKIHLALLATHVNAFFSELHVLVLFSEHHIQLWWHAYHHAQPLRCVDAFSHSSRLHRLYCHRRRPHYCLWWRRMRNGTALPQSMWPSDRADLPDDSLGHPVCHSIHFLFVQRPILIEFSHEKMEQPSTLKVDPLSL